MKKLVLKFIYNRLALTARQVIEKHHPFVIAITGSVGKTSTKEAIAQLLRNRYGDEVRSTYGNLNAEIGVPLTILGYDKLPAKKNWPLFLLQIRKHLGEITYPKYLVLEMGVEHPGDIESFCSITRPDLAVITAATPAHLANFDSLEQMQDEKLSLADNLKQNGKVIYNSDDRVLNQRIATAGISFAINDIGADFHATNIRVTIAGNQYILVCGSEKINISSRLTSRQMIYSDLAAVAVASLCGISLDDIKKGLEDRQSYPGRFNILPGKNGSTLIDDTYNASPASVEAAADALGEIDFKGRKVMILGGMNELGEASEHEHLKMARYIDGKADLIVLANPYAVAMSKNIKQSQCLVYSNCREVEKNLGQFLQGGELILVKASQNKNYFEELVKILLKDQKDSQNLVRQGSEWVGKKNKV